MSWSASSDRKSCDNSGVMVNVLPEVQPWLVLKNDQATLLLEAMTLKRSLTPGQTGFLPQNRDAIVERLDQIYTDIRVLNTRGRKEVTNEYVT